MTITGQTISNRHPMPQHPDLPDAHRPPAAAWTDLYATVRELWRGYAAGPVGLTDPADLANIPTVPDRISALVPAGHCLVVVALGGQNRDWVATWLREYLPGAFMQDAVGTPPVTVESTARYLTRFPVDGSGVRRVIVITAQDWASSRKRPQDPVVSVAAAELLSDARDVPDWAMDQLVG